MHSPGELSLMWRALERTGPRPSAFLNVLRAIGAIALMVAFVGSSIVRMWLGARAAAIFTGPIRLYSRLTLRLLGVKLEVEGREKLDRAGPHLLMANHGSLLDVFIFGSLCAQPTMFVVKKEMGRIPFIGRLLKQCGHVLLDRDHAVRAMRELNRTIKNLKSGGRALIFPEGTRHPDGVLGPFRSGAFVVAARAQVPLIPIAVLGAAACCPKNPFAFRPGTVRVVILDPIETTDWSDDTPDTHAATVREVLAAQIARYREERSK
jgi:1-acyl-sn-glycerol-3-phosphate acyltransferase